MRVNNRSIRMAGRVALSAMLLSGMMSLARTGPAQGVAPAGTPTGATRQVGTVKTATDHDFVLTDGAGQDHTVDISPGARVLIVPPGSKDLSAATSGTATDLQPGDKVIVTGKPGESGQGMTATRVIVMKGAAIAQTKAADEAAWARGLGGVVRSVEAASDSVKVSSGSEEVTVKATPKTTFRRYSGGSVRFEDAKVSTIGDVQPGDHLRARGTRTAEGNVFDADEVVTGSFHDYSGEIASIDAAAETLTLKDLATKKMVTVAITPQSNLRRLPAEAAARYAARERASSGSEGRSGAPQGARGRTSGNSTSGAESGGGARPRAGNPAQAGGGPGSPRGAAGSEPGAGPGSRPGLDLSTIMSRLPTENLGGLKPGEAVMIVANSPASAGKPIAITLLAGVESILAAAPAGEGVTLSPWSVGGGGEADAAAGTGAPQ